MENIDILQEAIPINLSELHILPTFFNFFMCIFMSFIIRHVYVQRSFSLTGKNHIGSIFPILSAVVFLVIIVVKSSLALSLGLVGALSIVRFRTPIKEPEELVYLFLSIAVGLGYAAGHTLITTLLTFSILAIIYFRLSGSKEQHNLEYNFIVNWKDTSIQSQVLLDEIISHNEDLKLARLETTDTGNSMVLIINPNNQKSLDEMINALQKKDADLTCSFFEARSNW